MEPDPSAVAPWYLRNINQALALDETTGNVYLRTDAQIGDVTITGNVNIPGTVAATQSGNWNVGLLGNLAGITGNVTVVDGGGSLTIDGNVGISGTANVSLIQLHCLIHNLDIMIMNNSQAIPQEAVVFYIMQILVHMS